MFRKSLSVVSRAALVAEATGVSTCRKGISRNFVFLSSCHIRRNRFLADDDRKVQLEDIRNWSSEPRLQEHEVSQKLKIKKAIIDKDSLALEIGWDDENSETSKFPLPWLRDNCQCERCFHPVTKSRQSLFADVNLKDVPSLEKVGADQTEVKLTWGDGHCSTFQAEWLKEREFSLKSKTKRNSFIRLPRIFWGSELLENLPTINFNDVLNEDEALMTWLKQLETYGFVLVKNAPSEYGQNRRLADRIAHIKQTHYGAEFFVKSKDKPSNLAYVTGPLQLHQDLPFYEYTPGLQFIHCIVQHTGKGGDSLIADAMHVGTELQKRRPDLFDCLASTEVDWIDVGEDEGGKFYKLLRKPTFCLNQDGSIVAVHVNHATRDSHFNVDLDRARRWYEAMQTFHAMLHDPKYCLQFKMKAGDIQTFDNMRVLHGRTDFTEGSRKRELEGCYVDWDEVRSRRRVLQIKLNDF